MVAPELYSASAQQGSFLCSSSPTLGTLESPACPETSRARKRVSDESAVRQESALLSHGGGDPTGDGRFAHRPRTQAALEVGFYQLSEVTGSLRVTHAG